MTSHGSCSTSTQRDSTTDSTSKKRRRVETEASGFNYSKSTNYPRTGPDDGKSLKNKIKIMEIDRCKKLQCSVILKLMVHRYGWAFMQPVNPRALGVCKSDYCDILSKPVNLGTIKSKFDKGLYLGTDEFAADIRHMLSDAIFSYPPRNENHRIAKKFREDFETRWKSLEDRWASEKAKKREIQKGPNINADGSMASEVEQRRRPVSASNKELKKPISESKQHFRETIVAAQERLRKKEREAARGAVEKTQRTVYMDENLKSFKELELLCGHSLLYCSSLNPLKNLGLVLKDEWMNG